MLDSLFLIHFLNMQDYPHSASLYIPHSPSEIANPKCSAALLREERRDVWFASSAITFQLREKEAYADTREYWEETQM